MGFWKATWSAIVAGLVVLYFPKFLDWVGLLPEKLDFLLVWSQKIWSVVSVTVPVPVAFLAIMGMYVGRYFTKLSSIERLTILHSRLPEEETAPVTAAPVPEAPVREQSVPVDEDKEYPLSDEEDRIMFLMSSSGGGVDAGDVFKGVELSQLRFEHAVEGLKRQGYLKEHYDLRGRTFSLTHEGRQLVIDHDIDKIPF